jgi:hypothetical protein
MRGWKATRNSDRHVVQEGDDLMVDDNLPVKFVRIASEPWGDDSTGEYFTGRVTVRYSWGSEEDVTDHRAGVTVSEA